MALILTMMTNKSVQLENYGKSLLGGIFDLKNQQSKLAMQTMTFKK
jgi:hypothetical protein